eukprot:CAMPEP_0206309128 /NCGR_PEP_ID=MMETSP0106_2-20121207/12223_1 /ASSEMBLY_ACC=CAM_ASM_000206 /TAXON_ID=81532 /ORGANISM="Acanthoeca-like sp., Strain 10tr" /LENGTH=489 /DNA_ID=CAMNT_0053740205 /DNA_START=6 /DNA_END=1475 /DNA_ORIENTATION=+
MSWWTVTAYVAAAAMAGRVSSQDPTISTDGSTITATAWDLQLNMPGNMVASLSTLAGQTSSLMSQMAVMNSQMSMMASQLGTAGSTAIAASNAVNGLQSSTATNFANINATNATLSALGQNLTQGIQGLVAQVDQDRGLFNILQGTVAQVSTRTASRASVTQLNALRADLLEIFRTNSSTLIAALANCTNAGSGAFFDPSTGVCTIRNNVTRVFTCVGPRTQTFTVPAGVTSMNVQMWGGGGAGSAWNTGGAGGYVAGTLATRPGTRYAINVACSQGAGQWCPGNCGRFYRGAWPGATYTRNYAASGGGGYTGMFEGTVSAPNAVGVAGAGGGGGGGDPRYGSERGGAAGGVNGQDGIVNSNSGGGCDRGGGGTQTSGGTAGCLTNGGRRGMQPGGSLTGGMGDDGGGGGAGWFGGGGGSRGGSWIHAGGGGGSSYTGRLTNAVNYGGNYRSVHTAAQQAPNYQSGIAVGGSNSEGGPGLLVINFVSRT